MQGEKTMKIIETVRNMTDHEADILEVFMSGFRAGKQVSKQEIGNESVVLPAALCGPGERHPARIGPCQPGKGGV